MSDQPIVKSPVSPAAMQKAMLRTMCRGAYDIQDLRISLGNRLCAAFRVKLGLESSQKEEEDPEAAGVLAQLRAEYDKITVGVVAAMKKAGRKRPGKPKFTPGAIIESADELAVVEEYIEQHKLEEKLFKNLGKMLPKFPIWNEFLEPTVGVGPAMGSLIISEIDISMAKYPSSLWKMCGLDVEKFFRFTKPGLKDICVAHWDNTKMTKLDREGWTSFVEWSGRSRRSEHLVMRQYKDKAGEDQERLSITFCPRLKTKLTGVLSGCFMKNGNKEMRAHYDNYKHRIENMPQHMGKTPKHRHNMSIRFMIKMFLLDLYRKWRALENLEVYPSWHERNGHTHNAGRTTA